VDFSQLLADVPTLVGVIIGVPVVLAAYIVLQFVADQSKLDSILAYLDQVQATAYK